MLASAPAAMAIWASRNLLASGPAEPAGAVRRADSLRHRRPGARCGTAGEVTAALVPIENSVEGGVTATLDNLTYGEPLVIIREVLLPVQFTLGRPGTRLDEVRTF